MKQTTLLIIICLAAALASCRSVRTVPVESVRTDTVVRIDTVVRTMEHFAVDTLRIREIVSVESRDSIAPVLDSLNRVIGYERWHWRESASESETLRSRLMASVDSILASSRALRLQYSQQPVVVHDPEHMRSWPEIILGALLGAMLGCTTLAVAYIRLGRKN